MQLAEGGTPNSGSPEGHSNKRTSKCVANSVHLILTIFEGISSATEQRSVSYETDSTGDFDEEIPSKVTNPKAREIAVTPEPGADSNGNDTVLPSSSTKTEHISYPSCSLPRPRRCAADRKNYNEKKYFHDLFGPDHKRKYSTQDG